MKCQAKTGANEQAIEREMFRSGAGRPPFRATPLTSTPNARAAALPRSGVPVGGDTSCSSSNASATVESLLKEIRDIKRQHQQGMDRILDELKELKQELKRTQEKSFQIRGSELQV